MKREQVKRSIYNNYDLWEDYSEYVKENCIENDIEQTDKDIWDEIYFQDSINWDDEKERLLEFFNNGNTWILQGISERWTGKHRGGYIFTEFMEMFYKATRDCDYIHIYDMNGHFYIKCSHHDGTNLYEIKQVNSKGVKYLENWEDNCNDKRTEEEIHDNIMDRYSTLPNFAHIEYGCPKVEYEKQTA